MVGEYAAEYAAGGDGGGDVVVVGETGEEGTFADEVGGGGVSADDFDVVLAECDEPGAVALFTPDDVEGGEVAGGGAGGGGGDGDAVAEGGVGEAFDAGEVGDLGGEFAAGGDGDHAGTEADADPAALGVFEGGGDFGGVGGRVGFEDAGFGEADGVEGLVAPVDVGFGAVFFGDDPFGEAGGLGGFGVGDEDDPDAGGELEAFDHLPEVGLVDGGIEDDLGLLLAGESKEDKRQDQYAKNPSHGAGV